MYCLYVAKRKGANQLLGNTAQVICAFVFYAKTGFSHKLLGPVVQSIVSQSTGLSQLIKHVC